MTANAIEAATTESAPEVVQPTPLCPNCKTPLQGPFCYACGQSKKGLIRHFSSIVGDFLDSVLSLDSRTFRTIGPLYLKPGHLTNEYFEGRRVRYVTPLRLYFFLSVVAFLVIAPSSDNVAPAPSPEITTPEQREKTLANLEQALRFMPAEQAREVRAEVERELAAQAEKAKQAQSEQNKSSADSESATEPAADAAAQDDDAPHIRFTSDSDWDPVTNPVTFSWFSDGMNRALNEEIGVLVEKGKQVNRDPRPFVRQLFGLAPQALFAILPIFALLLRICYVFKRRLYMEHLIVALHSHSFICFSMILIALIKYAMDAVAPYSSALETVFGWLMGLTIAWIPIYLLIMQKRVYKQWWITTLLMYLVVGTLYLLLISFGLLGAMVVSLALL
jgi:hypothetical protein